MAELYLGKVNCHNFTESAISRNLDVIEIKNTRMFYVQVHAARFSGSAKKSIVGTGCFLFPNLGLFLRMVDLVFEEVGCTSATVSFCISIDYTSSFSKAEKKILNNCVKSL